MRVLQVLLSPRVGGAEALVDQLSTAWRSAGIVTEVAYLEDSIRGSGKWARWKRLRAEIDGFGPDVILAHSALPNLYARLAVRRADAWSTRTAVPVVTVLHSATDDHANRALRSAERVLRSRTAHVVAVSPTQVHDYLSHFPHAADRISVIRNGVRGDLVSDDIPAASASRVGVLARIVEQKRPDLWVRAAQLVLDDFPDLRFSWWGTMPGPTQFESLIRQSPSEFTDHSFRGETTDVPGALQQLDICFHTSDREAMSIALLEAACAGVPIVCSDAVGLTLPADVVADHFRAGDAQDAARVLKTALTGHAERSGRARASAPALQRRFGMDSCASAYVRLFRSTTAS